MMSWLARQDGYDPNAFDVPGEQTYDRRLDQTWPGQLAQDAIGAVLAPGRALQSTEPITTEQMIKPAMDMAGLVTGGSYAAPAQRGASGAGIRAYHSSPHDFDKFDLAKIGTGEGAQVYGHGLYFAENPAVSGQGGQYWQQFLHRFDETPEYLAAHKLKEAGFNRADAAALAQANVNEIAEALKSGTHPPGLQGGPFDEHVLRNITKNMLYNRQAELDLLRSNKPVGPRTYEVNINADPAHMLDWDKAISTQPHVEEALRRGGFIDAKWPYSGMQGAQSGTSLQPLTSGEDAYRALGIEKRGRNAPVYDQRKAATDVFGEAGIPGIKYLDQGSRATTGGELLDVVKGPQGWQSKIRMNRPNNEQYFTTSAPHASEEAARQWALDKIANQGTSNYVIFDPNLIDITKKYAVPGAIGAGGMGALAAQDEYRGAY